MKIARLVPVIIIILTLSSCGSNDRKKLPGSGGKQNLVSSSIFPLDKGFSEYISAYTSGIIPANGSVVIHFTPEFAAKIEKSTSGLFTFEPTLKGKSEWKDETTLVFTPARLLDQSKTYSGVLNLYKLGEVKERLKQFPLRIQTVRKDFRVIAGSLKCTDESGSTYSLHGELVTSDYIESYEAEDYLNVKLGKKKMGISWDHSVNLIHKFTIANITRTDEEQELTLTWDGAAGGLKQKGSSVIKIPENSDFSVLEIKQMPGDNQNLLIVFSDPVDASQDMDGLVFYSPATESTIDINSNIVRIFPESKFNGKVELNIEKSIRNKNGLTLTASLKKEIDFSAIPPGIKLEGNGIIVPTSQNLIFPFKAANLKAVDLKIVKIFENNLPYFLQEYDLNTGYSVKRFGRPVYSGRVDLVTGSGANTGSWNLYTIDLADYITVEPGVLYKVYLGMRKSYSLFPCSNGQDDNSYEEKLQLAEEQSREFWEDPENYYEDSEWQLYYSFGFNWRDRNDPCNNAYYSPDRKVSRNILASNLGIIAKMGVDNILHVMVNDLITAIPSSEVNVEVFDYQMQLITSGNTNTDGSVTLSCERSPFLVIVKKDNDRNYLKTNDGSSLSLSSFDVSGSSPEKGIKAFIYGERDVWRPGDSIYLSVFIKDLQNILPAGHPVHFELINPLEQRVDNQIQKAENSNLLVFKTSTSPEALTGNYKAQFRIGGATFSKRIRIETVKPNRLKMDLSFPEAILGGSSSDDPGTLNVKWLNGTIAKEMKASVEYLLKHTGTVFDKYGQYVFDDPVNEFYAETVNIFDKKIDVNGNANVVFDPGKEINAPGMLNAVFTIKVSEPGGDESITQKSLKYAPYDVFAGINLPGLKGKSRMLFTDADNEVKIVTLDKNGKPVNSHVEISVYKISYRWWWESDNEDLAYYISYKIYKPVLSETITTVNGEGNFSFRINKEEWGRYLIRASTPSGHSTGKIILIDWPWEYGMKGNTDGATLLAINTNKEKYNPGDNVELSFPAPENARAIITLENSGGIVNEIRINTGKGNSTVSFKATPEMAPNVYAYVTVIQPHAQTVNDMPVRLYGIVPIMVEDPDTRLNPIIETADEIRSQKPFTIKVREEDKKAMTYTLAVVDEGLLDLTGFRTPNPWNYFYSREALGVKTWDLYDFVLGAFGGTLDRVMAVGGDEAIIDKAANKAQRFIPVVKFLGPFVLDAGKTGTHTLTLPQYTGSVRVMVVAGGQNAFGSSEKSVKVKDPLMVLVTAPRVISPGEQAALPLTLFVQKEGIRQIVVKAESNGLVSFEETSKNISVSGMGEKEAEFTFRAGEKRGVANITVRATAGTETATYNLQLEVRSPNPPEQRSEMKIISEAEKWESTFVPFGITGTNSAIINISALPTIDFEKRIDFLLGYPHGCTEQIISAAFPQLWISALYGDDAERVETSANNIREAISKLVSRQMINGGMALWPGSTQPDNWVSSYAGHFITEAMRMGYSVPSDFSKKLLSYQKKSAQEWRYDPKFKYTANDQAYRLFTLALAGETEKGAMNRLRETAELPQLSRWLLAAAFATSGRPEVAGDIIDMRKHSTEQEYQRYYYGSAIRDKAIVLYTLTLLKKEEESLPLLKEICDDFNNNSWYSTQSIAWGLFSYMKWLEMIPEDKQNNPLISLKINGEVTEATIEPKDLWSKNLTQLRETNSLSIENKSGRPVYATVTRKGIPLVSDKLREEKGLLMKIDYLNMDLKPINHLSLSQGTGFMMLVKVTNSSFSKVENIALTQMVPSGWEIQNTRLFEANFGIKEDAFEYRDFRDDRVNTYFGLNRGESKTFVLLLNAAYKGEFYLPSVYSEAMYTDNFYSRYPGGNVKVTGE